MEPTKPATSRAATPVARSSASTQLLALGGAAIGCGSAAQVTLACFRRSLRAQRRRRGRLGHACRPGARTRGVDGPQTALERAEVLTLPEFDAPSSARIALATAPVVGVCAPLGCRAASPAARPCLCRGPVVSDGEQAGRRVRAQLPREAAVWPRRARARGVRPAATWRRTPAVWHFGVLQTAPRRAASAFVRRLRCVRRGALPQHSAPRRPVAREAHARGCDHGTAEDFHVCSPFRRSRTVLRAATTTFSRWCSSATRASASPTCCLASRATSSA
jgi:hypothetical protein